MLTPISHSKMKPVTLLVLLLCSVCCKLSVFYLYACCSTHILTAQQNVYSRWRDHGWSAGRRSGSPGRLWVWRCNKGRQTHQHTQRTVLKRRSRPADRSQCTSRYTVVNSTVSLPTWGGEEGTFTRCSEHIWFYYLTSENTAPHLSYSAIQGMQEERKDSSKETQSKPSAPLHYSLQGIWKLTAFLQGLCHLSNICKCGPSCSF